MKSMTGYGYTEKQTEDYSLMIEIKSYNNRYCDIFVNTPSHLSPLEQKIREYLSGRLNRGRIEVSIRFRELEEDLAIGLDKKTAERYMSILTDLAEMNNITAPITLSHLLHMDGVIKIQRNQDMDRYWNLIFPFFEQTFDVFFKSREKEGSATEKDILECLSIIENASEQFKNHACEMEQKIITQLQDKFKLVVGEDYDQGRLLSETAVMLVKYSFSEEIVRLQAHTESFKSIMKDDKAIGKKLDFLCQEINREINTIGSKSIILEVNQAVVEAKDGLERIREQLRNVE